MLPPTVSVQLDEVVGELLRARLLQHTNRRVPGLPARVRGLIEPGARCLVVEDSAHDYETTSAALRGFAQFVSVGGFFVVEDGVVDVEALRVDEDWPRGVRKATEDWLQRDGSGLCAGGTWSSMA